MDQKTLDDYYILSELGSGMFGTVYKARRLSDNKIIALKVINIPSTKSDTIEKTELEIDTLKKLADPKCNPFVICYYNSYYDIEMKQFLIEMELVEGKEMDEYVDDLWQNKSKEMVYYYLLLIAKDLLMGLKYTHDHNIIHNDIKLDNIMIDTNNTPRIIDYGLSCSATQINNYKYCQSYGGTPNYVAPELFIDDMRFPASDLWALGITLYVAATQGEYPYDKSDNTSVQTLFDTIRDENPKKLQTTNSQLNDLVNGLLIKNYRQRLTVNRALEMLKVIPRPDRKIFETGEITETDKKIFETGEITETDEKIFESPRMTGQPPKFILNPLKRSALNSWVFL